MKILLVDDHTTLLDVTAFEPPGAGRQFIATIPGIGYTISNERGTGSRTHGDAES